MGEITSQKRFRIPLIIIGVIFIIEAFDILFSFTIGRFFLYGGPFDTFMMILTYYIAPIIILICTILLFVFNSKISATRNVFRISLVIAICFQFSSIIISYFHNRISLYFYGKPDLSIPYFFVAYLIQNGFETVSFICFTVAWHNFGMKLNRLNGKIKNSSIALFVGYLLLSIEYFVYIWYASVFTFYGGPIIIPILAILMLILSSSAFIFLIIGYLSLGSRVAQMIPHNLTAEPSLQGNYTPQSYTPSYSNEKSEPLKSSEKFCGNCGNPLPYNVVKYCPYCGNSLN